MALTSSPSTASHCSSPKNEIKLEKVPAKMPCECRAVESEGELPAENTQLLAENCCIRKGTLSSVKEADYMY